MEGIKIHRSLPQGPRPGPDIARPLVLPEASGRRILPCGRHNHRATSLARLGMTSRLTFSPSINPSLLPKGEISAFLNSGQITTGGLVSQVRQQQISSQRVEPRRVFFFSRPPVVLHSGGHVVCTCEPSQVCAYRGAHRPGPLIMAFTWILSFPRITWRQLAAGLLSPSLLLETLIMQSSSTFPAIPEPRRVES